MKGSSTSAVALLAVCCCALALGAGLLVDPNKPPTVRTPNCTEGGCHASIIEFRHLHAPAAVGACDACHVYDDVAKHTFTLKHTGAQMCDFCHIGKSTFTTRDGLTGLHVHEPVREGDCTGCHNPHGGSLRHLINAETVGAMCLTCHTDAATHVHVHTPVAQGDCTSCHQSHASLHAGLLLAPQRELCMSCHADAVPVMSPQSTRRARRWSLGNPISVSNPSTFSVFAAPPAGNDRMIDERRFVHEPVLGECSQCHDHHGSDHPGILREELTTLCTSCHEDTAKAMAHATVPHSAVNDDRACLNCHVPHHNLGHDRPRIAALLRDAPIKLCMDCHETVTKRADGSTVASMAYLHDSGQMLHAPLAMSGTGAGGGNCQDCHSVHGGTRPALLTAKYSQEFYLSYSAGAFELCFTCHDSALASQQHTRTATKFRDGDVNLHYVHVTAQGDSGRSCRLCHTEHASKQPRLLKKSVPYGEWTLPITFAQTPSGGTCGPGCHRERTYGR